MKKIKFVPLGVPLKQRLQLVAAAMAVFIMIMGAPLGTLLLLYVLFYTHHWPEALVYIIWVYFYDTDVCEEGGRRSIRVQAWTWWKYFKEYFPLRLDRVPWVELDPNKNYLFCCFPHGVLPMGVFSAFGTEWGGFRDLFPKHTVNFLTLRLLLLLPILRELLLALGACAASAKSMDTILGTGSGKVAAILVGGAAEAFYNKPGSNRLVLRNRKGFVRVALRNGSPLVPVYSFGETNVYNQVENSRVRRFQEWCKLKTGVAPIIPLGRGIFQYTYGMVPFRTPVYTVVGRPIEFEKIANPTPEQVDALHARFIKELEELFEEQKYNYLPNPEEAKLIID